MIMSIKAGTMRIPIHVPAAIVLSLAFLSFPGALPAQNKGKDPPKHQDHTDPWTRGSADENELIQKVRHSLLMLPYYGIFDDLGFKVDGGTVTLSGEVTRPTLKDDAGSAVKHLAGVTDVINNIEVLPLSPNDDRLRIAASRTIYGDPSLSMRYGNQAAPPIHIIVKNGNIRLEGVVASEMDRNVAGIRAKGVHGAFDVQNDLRVEGK
jgi:hyperosmotically inducible protein